ncbi:calpain family cysteine protease [Purpureocillium lavendulum]|uniref:Calpain family cysteine protease n=1 Tax=Purpureocillium lavendulum TaxID=1247861 RepID=A0AB34FW26_9HYPO|nr:calpain family cysteine protease [Purpureocillium lavendulum]
MSFRGFNPSTDVPSLRGEAVVVVTGGTAGLGRETVLELARHAPRHVFFTGRDRAAGASLVAACAPYLAPLTEGDNGDGTAGVPDSGGTSSSRGHISFIECDHASLASVRTAAEAILRLTTRLDVLVANAGIMATPPGLTADGLEVQFGTNHAGNAALLLRLLPLMLQTATLPGADVRFVSVTSVGYFAHPAAGINFAALTTPDGGAGSTAAGGAWARYGQSKLANILLAGEVRRRYGGRGVASVAVHPGTVRTGLVARLGFWNRALVYATNPRGLLGPREGSYNIVWAAAGGDARDRLLAVTTDEATAAKKGCRKGRAAFFGPVGVPDAGDAKCWDEGLARELWEWTERTVGVEGPA